MDPGIRIIRWDDNKIFNLAHTFGSGYPTIRAERWHCDNTKTSKLKVRHWPMKVFFSLDRFNYM